MATSITNAMKTAFLSGIYTTDYDYVVTVSESTDNHRTLWIRPIILDDEEQEITPADEQSAIFDRVTGGYELDIYADAPKLTFTIPVGTYGKVVGLSIYKNEALTQKYFDLNYPSNEHKTAPDGGEYKLNTLVSTLMEEE